MDTPLQNDIITGLVCDEEREYKYSEWCINNSLSYHIGYPNILCFDSMLVSLPVINPIVDLYGNFPVKDAILFTTTLAEWSGIRFENNDCLENEEMLTYQMWVEKEDLETPEEITIKFYFYDNSQFPTDSSEVLFLPWSP